MSIRVRKLVDGTVMYDARGVDWRHSGKRSIHLGTFYTRERAQEMIRFWREGLERDKEILYERQLGIPDRAS